MYCNKSCNCGRTNNQNPLCRNYCENCHYMQQESIESRGCLCMKCCCCQGATGATGPAGIGITGATGVTGPTGPTGATGALPYPTSADFYSIIAQTLAPTGIGRFTPVPLTISTPYYINLEDDGYTITIQKQGLFLITYSITPSAGANANASVALGQTRGGILLLSHRPMIANNTSVTGSFVATLGAGEQLYLGVSSTETVTLPGNAKRWANATLSITQVG